MFSIEYLHFLIIALAASVYAIGTRNNAASFYYGKSIIFNHCAETVYYTTTGSSDTLIRSIHPNSSVINNLQTRENGGFSTKISKSKADLTMGVGQLQIEYTTEKDRYDEDLIWWDGSLINKGNATESEEAFILDGFSIVCSSESGKVVVCAAGETDCQAVYQEPDDNQVVQVCHAPANITTHLCLST